MYSCLYRSLVCNKTYLNSFLFLFPCSYCIRPVSGQLFNLEGFRAMFLNVKTRHKLDYVAILIW